MINQFKYLLIIFIFSMTSCSQQTNEEISARVTEIQKSNIPDKRLMFWNIDVISSEGENCLSGETASEKGFSELKSLAVQHNLKFEVELLPTERFKENRWGVVTLSVCNIRGKATHSSELLSQALLGTPVKVYKEVDGWYLIQTPDRYFGWVDDAAVSLKSNPELADWKNLKKVLFNKQFGFAYAGIDENTAIESDLLAGDLLSVIDSENKFYKTLFADGRIAFVKKEDCVSLEKWQTKKMVIDDVIATALKFKGLPYLWGGTSSKMLDCSGFTKTVYYMNGIILQRDASQQTLHGELVDTANGYENLLPGDLVFFGRKASADTPEKVTHVGLYIGEKEFIHASGKVRINSLDKTKENYTEHYENAFVRSRRVIENVKGEGIEWIVDNEFYKEILP
ncbi:NlpC/P60 family protein [uncultured Draconibacterium sp.]|uniref:C40 family peptidase n=1 Tax=uncultured Draconibacterium sp. TaxID=1573823 RepID=UPI003216D152